MLQLNWRIFRFNQFNFMLFLFKTTLMFIEGVDLILMSEKFSPVAEFIDMQGFILTHSLLKGNKWM